MEWKFVDKKNAFFHFAINHTVIQVANDYDCIRIYNLYKDYITVLKKFKIYDFHEFLTSNNTRNIIFEIFIIFFN